MVIFVLLLWYITVPNLQLKLDLRYTCIGKAQWIKNSLLSAFRGPTGGLALYPPRKRGNGCASLSLWSLRLCISDMGIMMLFPRVIPGTHRRMLTVVSSLSHHHAYQTEGFWLRDLRLFSWAAEVFWASQPWWIYPLVGIFVKNPLSVLLIDMFNWNS